MTARPDNLRAFVRVLVAKDRRSLTWVAFVQLMSTITQGLGLLLLVPLLQVAGVGGSGAARTSGGLASLARSLFSPIGVSVTLRSLLVAYVVMVAVTASLNAYASVRL